MRIFVLAAFLVGITACGGDDPTTSSAAPTPTPPTTASPTGPASEPDDPAPTEAAAECGEVEHPPVQGGEHLIGDQEPPVPYSSTPPTSGWHTSGAFEITVFDEPISEPKQVSVLEAGGVMVTYRDLEDADREALEDLVTDEFDGRAAIAPYEELEPGEVALAAWGMLQVCDGVDLETVSAFIDEHAVEDPDEPGHGH